MRPEPNSSGLPATTIASIQSVLAGHPEVQGAILYGSRAKGNYRNGSDIDLTLLGECVSPSLLLKIDNELDDLMTPYTFDLSAFARLESLTLIDHINRCGVSLYDSADGCAS